MPKFALQQQQSLSLNSRVLTGLKILQLSQAQLAETISELLEKNPLLEIEPPSDSAPKQLADKTTKESIPAKKSNKDTADLDYEQESAQTESLQDFLRNQCDLCAETDDTKSVMLIIIDSLTEDGYLRTPANDLINDFKLSRDKFEQALKAVQKLEPSGVGATSLSQCLILQLQQDYHHLAEHTLAIELVNEHLSLVAEYPDGSEQIAKILDIDHALIESACRLIRQLNPKPGLHFGTVTENYVRPDIIVRESNQTNSGFVADVINQPNKLRLNQSMLMLVKTDKNQDSESKDWINTNKSEAENILNALDFRQSTLQRIADLLAELQGEYFNKGLKSLKPYSLTQAAEALNLNPSTLSRAIDHKFLTSPQGTEAIRELFSTALPKQQDLTNRYAKAVLLDIIKKEPSQAPLNDGSLAKAMLEVGIDISRRAVTKYRLALSIPNSRVRRIPQ